MANIKNLTKEELFLASVLCPKCGKLMGMRVNHNRDYAYRCLECNENFHAYECSNTVLDHMYKQGKFVPVYGITLRVRSFTWYKDNKDTLEIMYDKYKAAALGCDHYSVRIDGKFAVIDFGWEKAPSDKTIQNFTDDVIKFFSEQEEQVEVVKLITDNAMGMRILSILQTTGKTQKEFAEEVGISEVSLSRYIAGSRVPKADILNKIAKALNVTADYLLGSVEAESSIKEFNSVKAWLTKNAKELSAIQKAELAEAIFQ